MHKILFYTYAFFALSHSCLHTKNSNNPSAHVDGLGNTLTIKLADDTKLKPGQRVPVMLISLPDVYRPHQAMADKKFFTGNDIPAGSGTLKRSAFPVTWPDKQPVIRYDIPYVTLDASNKKAVIKKRPASMYMIEHFLFFKLVDSKDKKMYHWKAIPGFHGWNTLIIKDPATGTFETQPKDLRTFIHDQQLNIYSDEH